MKLILDMYGKALLEAAAVVLLLTFLFFGVTDQKGNTGIFHVAGAKTDTGNIIYGTYKDFKNYASEGEYRKPRIVYDDNQVLTVGKCDLAEYIHAYDYNGNQLPIRIVTCSAPDGLLLSPDSAESSLTLFEFKTDGIYRVRVSAADESNRKNICEFSVPVGSD